MGRVAVEVVLGAGLGAVGGVLGAYAGLNVDLLGGREAGAGLGVGTSFGVALGVAPGVWLGGRAMGGDGSYGWTMLGSALGAGAAAGILALDDTPVTLALSALIPVTGAILGYELSSHTRRAKAPPRDRTGVTVLPTIGPRSVGVVGTF